MHIVLMRYRKDGTIVEGQPPTSGFGSHLRYLQMSNGMLAQSLPRKGNWFQQKGNTGGAGGCDDGRSFQQPRVGDGIGG